MLIQHWWLHLVLWLGKVAWVLTSDYLLTTTVRLKIYSRPWKITFMLVAYSIPCPVAITNILKHESYSCSETCFSLQNAHRMLPSQTVTSQKLDQIDSNALVYQTLLWSDHLNLLDKQINVFFYINFFVFFNEQQSWFDSDSPQELMT